MSDYRGVSEGQAAMEGIAMGLNVAANNLLSIQAAKQKLKQSDEMFQLDKKIKEAELNKMEVIDPENARTHRELLKSQVDMQKAKTAYSLQLIEASKKKQEGEAQKLSTALKVLDATIGENNVVPEGTSVSLGGVNIRRNDPGLDSLIQYSPKPLNVKKSPYSTSQENLISENMKYHNRSREEIIAALKKKGML